MWGRYLAALKQLQVPADTAADLQDLIRRVSRLQAVSGEGGSDNRLRSTDARYQTRCDNVEHQDVVGWAACGPTSACRS